MKRNVVGRLREQEILQDVVAKKQPAFVAVYGRRRVGKTYLIHNGLNEQLKFELVGTKDASKQDQLANFNQQLSRASKGKFPANGIPVNWRDAFQEVRDWLESTENGKPYAIFFDEIPWLASRRSGFMQALDYFWNSWGSRQTNLILVVCGSAAAWMIDKFINGKGGLHNRVTHRIRLLPFNLNESREFLRSRRIKLTEHQIVELYMSVGGVPLYLEQSEKGESAAQIVDRVCFKKDGFLNDEYSNLYQALFDSPHRHLSIIDALAKKNQGMTRKEISNATKLEASGRLSSVIEELSASGFISSRAPFGRTKRGTVYQLADEYSRFYSRWIKNWRAGSGGWGKIRGTPKWRAWAGITFESLGSKHIEQMKQSLGISGIATEQSSWAYRPSGKSDTGAQIDLVIDRADNCINLVEMKFSDDEFIITKKYAETIRKRTAIFRRQTGTKKAIFNTFLTTHGVADNEYSTELVDSEVQLAELFNPSRK